MNIFEPNTLQIVLVRPGATDLDEQGRITGALDLPLSDKGRGQIDQTKRDLEHLNIDAIYSAPSAAAQETATALSRSGQVRVKVDENLKNLDYGLWHGKLLEELKTSAHPKAKRLMMFARERNAC